MGNILDLVFIFGAKYLYLIVIIAAFIWFLNQSNLRQKDTLIIFCICLPLIFIVSEIAGHFYYNPRPFVQGNFTPLIPHQPNNGFPSHHALLVSVVSAVIFLFSKRIGLILWALAIFVGISRVYAGVHHVIDIVASMLISIILVNLVYLLYAKLRKLNKKWVY